VSASVNLPLHHKVQKFSSDTVSSEWSRKEGCKTVVVVNNCTRPIATSGYRHDCHMLFTSYSQVRRIALQTAQKFNIRHAMHFSTILSTYNGMTAYTCRRFLSTTAFLVTCYEDMKGNAKCRNCGGLGVVRGHSRSLAMSPFDIAQDFLVDF